MDLGDRKDGVISEDGQIIGTYLHGLFDDSAARETLLQWMGLEDVAPLDYHALIEKEIDRLANELERALDMEKILGFMDAFPPIPIPDTDRSQ